MTTLFDSPTLDSRGRGPVGLALVLRRGLGVVNIAFAFTIAIALAVNIADRLIQGIFDPSHYFQFFTIQTCIINIVVLLMGGIIALTRTNDPRWYAVMRVSIVSYAIVVGVIYNVLLAGLDSGDGYVSTFSFPNDIQHIWAPIFIAVEWVLMPGRGRLRWGTLVICAIFPLAWVAGSLVRGLVGDGWFPYFFLNPAEMGVGGVAMYVGGIAVFTLANCAIAIAIGRVQARVFATDRVNRAWV
jgi:hypothetical protein